MLATLAALLTAAAAACPAVVFVPHDGALRFTGTDLAVAGSDLQVRRALTTSLAFEGQFGPGFGLEDELLVVPLAGGALRAVVPGPCPACSAAVPEPSPEALAAGVAGAAATLRASGVSGLAGEAEAYAAALRDPDYRRAEWEARQSGWLAAARLEPADGPERLPPAARYRVVALPSGYLRYADATQVQELDAAGRLVRVVNAAGLLRGVERDGAGRITRLLDRRGRWIAFTLDGGRVVRAEGSDGGAARYGYDPAGRLAWSEGAEGRADYGWSAEGQLVRVETKGRTILATYQPPAAGGRVLSLDDGQGVKERYAYQGQPGGMARAVTVYADDEAAAEAGPARAGPRELRHHSFVEPRAADGRRWTWQATTEEDGQVTTTTYDGRTFQPLSIASGDRLATFGWDEGGRLVEKAVDGEVRRLTYAPGGRVASVEVASTGDADEAAPRVTRFWYDAAGRLARAASPDAEASVGYDAEGRVAAIDLTRDGEARRLTIEYGPLDRPARLSARGVGEIAVRYDARGEIEKVDSSGGPAVALAVTSTLGALLELSRAAEVEVSAW